MDSFFICTFAFIIVFFYLQYKDTHNYENGRQVALKVINNLSLNL